MNLPLANMLPNKRGCSQESPCSSKKRHKSTKSHPSWAEEAPSSSIPAKCKYDVFVSFSGVDTRKNFTSHLLAALGRHGFCTFRDDKELIRGEYISDGLLKAIEESRISVIVFSKKYAESRWCLDELVKIMDCRKTLKQIVLPIFYGIDPSDVRGQKGSLEVAFAKHEDRFKEGSDGKVQKWREALTDAANLSGWDSQNVANGDEAELIQIIVKEVGKKTDPTHLDVADHQVGLESRLQKLNILLGMESNDVRIVGIWGIGGIGKTTIAKEMYNRMQCKFESSSFLADVRETSKQPNGIVVLQEQLLSDIFRNEAPNIRNVHQGIAIIKQRALCRKALIVLDDVDDDKQLKALAIDRECFGPGSRIIITTRDRSLLYFLGVGENEIYAPDELDKDESLELFSWHAFKKGHPKQDHLELSDQVVRYAGGIPLALEVLGGSFSFCRSITEWKSAIEELRIVHPHDIQGKLKISFDSLSPERKELFLDIACFFVGWDWDFTIKILEGCKNFSVVNAIRILVDRCLIKSKQYGYQIVMHDMLRDMGREIVKRECPEEPGGRSRLWYHEDVLDVLRDGTGTGAVKGLLLNFPEPNDVQLNAKAFGNMNKLWLLHLDYVRLATGYEHISKRLSWLSWKGFPLECMPLNLSMEKLVSLDLSYSSLKQVWKGTKVLSKLKFLYLSHCYYLTKTPDFSGLNNLEELLLNDCIRLVEVDESIRCLNKLLVLDMKNCKKLWKLSSDILMLKSLESLDLSGCSKLEQFAGFEVSPSKSLWSFLSPRTLWTKNVDSICSSLASAQSLSCLKELKMAYCNVSHLPSEIGRFISLEELDFRGNNLHTLPDNICFLTRLKNLNLSSCNLSHLPSEIGALISLETLDLERNNIRTLPDSICKQSRLKTLNLMDCSVSHLPTEFGKLSSLKTLMLGRNSSLTLPDSVCDLSSLEVLSMECCDLSHLPSGIGRLNSLQLLDLHKNNFRTLPDSICELTRLGELNLGDCARLQSLPELPRRHMPRIFCEGCNKVDANDFIKSLHENKGSSPLWSAFDIVLPARGEVPNGFQFQTTGSRLSFVVPPLVNQKIYGLILCIFFTIRDQEVDNHWLVLDSIICNKTIIYFDLGYYKGKCTIQDHVWLIYAPLSYLGLMQLEGGDEVEIPIQNSDTILVKMCGIDLIYEVDKSIKEINDDQALIQYTLSPDQDVILEDEVGS